MNKQEFLRSLSDVYCRIGITKHGVGVVAVRRMPKGTAPFKHCKSGKRTFRISVKELDAIDAPKEAKDMVRDFCALQDGAYYVPDFGLEAMDKSYFLNHSRKPNLVTHDEGDTFVASRDIKKGEELTVDYRTFNSTAHFKL